MWEKRNLVSVQLCNRALSTMLSPNGENASGFACKQKEDILNIFFNSIKTQQLLRNFFTKVLKIISCIIK